MNIVKLDIQEFTPDNQGISYVNTSYKSLEIPNECPHCGKTIYPTQLTSLNVEGYSNNDIASIFLCNACGKFIFTLNRESRFDLFTKKAIFPTPMNIKSFSEIIETVSPKFTKIYEQSAKAESNGFDEICGMGYRKALEFLIKDYATQDNSEKEEEIKNCTLSQCINTYCDNENIKALAIASAWIGNDETHYIRKHDDYSLDDLKAFIDVIVTYIEQKMTIKRASELLASHKNKE